MSSPVPMLDELELDALTELVNIGVSHAAAGLRDMVGEEVLLSVPKVALVTRTHALEILGKRDDDKLVAVHQAFEGDIAGRALLIFPETKSLELVRAVAGGDLPLDDIIELEQEALAETGNIILNGCLATMANMLHRSLRMSLPEIIRGRGPEFLDLAPPEEGDMVMFLYIDFTVRRGDINGYIALLMNMPALSALKTLLREFIARTGGELVSQADAGA